MTDRPKRHRLTIRTATGAALVLVFVLTALSTASAQRVQRIAATVNDDIVSVFDLESRLRLVVASSGIRVTPALQRRLTQQVLRTLIDERLQMQEAKRRNIAVTKRDMSRAFEALEKQNRLKPGTFEAFVRENRLPRDALMAQLRAQIAWAKLIRQTLQRRVTVGPEEIDEELARLKSRQGQSEYRVAEIVLSADTPEQEQEARRTAQRLIEQLRRGAQFSAVARQMSRSATASSGGDLGWIAETGLDSDLAAVVPEMKKAEIVGPLRSAGGIRILYLIDKRQILAGSSDDAVIDIRRLTLPLAETANQEAVEAQVDLARLMTETVSGCDDFERAAREAASVGPTSLGKQRVGDLARPIRDAIADLAIGKSSKPLRHSGGVSLYMVCAREDPTAGMPSRKEIENQIRNKRLENLARQQMRDLRNAATVDVRI